ncbi:MAG: Alcohol dehydrogenase zinc-binding domain protein [Microbacteriaceae bacterium]|nr:Alcohol dehydrogenase zinc-binding domain protein [Microbacteriaceae bacterium]
MPKVVIAPEFGQPSVLQVVERDRVEPGPGQVRIAVEAAAINPADLKKLRGQFGRGMTLPLTFGSEVAGIVDAVGPDVDSVSVGDDVIAYPVQGGFAAEVIAKAANVFAKPADLPWEQAAGILVGGVTAVHMLEAAAVAEGDTVIIHGASGSVGLSALQLAVELGARVIGTAGPTRLDLVARYGGEPVVYGTGLLERLRELLPEGADVALDTVGTDEALDTSVALVADRSRIVSVNGFARGGELGITLLGAGPGADPGTDIRNAARQGLIDAVGLGELDIVVGQTFALEDVAEAMLLAGSGHSDGKVVLLP